MVLFEWLSYIYFTSALCSVELLSVWEEAGRSPWGSLLFWFLPKKTSASVDGPKTNWTAGAFSFDLSHSVVFLHLKFAEYWFPLQIEGVSVPLFPSVCQLLLFVYSGNPMGVGSYSLFQVVHNQRAWEGLQSPPCMSQRALQAQMWWEGSFADWTISSLWGWGMPCGGDEKNCLFLFC